MYPNLQDLNWIRFFPGKTITFRLILTVSRNKDTEKLDMDNDNIDAMLQEILDDDYQPTSTHVSQITGQNLVMISEQSKHRFSCLILPVVIYSACQAICQISHELTGIHCSKDFLKWWMFSDNVQEVSL